MGNTKKVGSAGRFGSRYGVGIRKKLLKVEGKQEKNYACPFCGFKKVRRKAAGLYVCKKCQATFAGGAYLPSTLPGSIIRKTVSQKGIASEAKALERIMEHGPEGDEKEGHKEKGKK
jgi:large subunit ribosomal protein L37Ae